MSVQDHETTATKALAKALAGIVSIPIVDVVRPGGIATHQVSWRMRDEESACRFAHALEDFKRESNENGSLPSAFCTCGHHAHAHTMSGCQICNCNCRSFSPEQSGRTK